MLINKWFTVATVITLSGCAATPNLEYRDPEPDMQGFLKFTLPQSTIALQTKQGAITAIVVTDDEYEGSKDHSLMVDSMWSLWTSSTITKLEFVEGQNVVKAIATTAESNGSKVIGVVKDIISLAASTAPSAAAFEDDIIDPFTDKDGKAVKLLTKNTVDCNLRRNPNWKCSISIGDYPSWVIPYNNFHTLALNGSARKVFPASACVKATITLNAPVGFKPNIGGIPDAPGNVDPQTSDAKEKVSVNPDGTLAKNLGGILATGSSAKKDGIVAGRHTSHSMDVNKVPHNSGEDVSKAELNQPDETKVYQFTFGVELADPEFVNLTRLRAGGELQASGPCRFNVTNDKAASNLDTQAFTDAVSLVKSLKKKPGEASK